MRAVKPERGHRQGAPVKMADTSTDMASELTKSSDQMKAELRNKGVVQGLTNVISEPSTQYNCRFLNAHDFENWVRNAEPHMLDKIKMTKKSKFEEIAFGSILQDVKTSRGDTKVCKILLLLGPAGIGKTTALNRLACHDLLKNKIVIVSDFRMFDPLKKIRPSRALLSKMCSDNDSERMTQRYRWMKHNSDQVAVIVDSLDTMPFDLQKEHQPIHDDEPVTIEVIAYNLFARKLFPNAIVISSSREYKIRIIHESVRPDRCVIIDGLTDKSAKALLEGFLGKEKAVEVMEHIENECPDIWPLLRIPVFLQYTAVAFASKVHGFKPNTMSGILIRFFENLVRSPHVLVKNVMEVLRRLMPMSFAAMKKAKVQFTPKDLEDYGVEVAEVTDLGTLVPQRGTLPLVGKLMHGDRFYLYFHHQTMQEFLAALHALSIGKMEFETSVLNEVQEENFTVVYKLMCGILLNREVLEAALEFVEILDVEEKRSILLGNLQSNLNKAQRLGPSEVLEVFINLNEAKDGVAELIRSSVRKMAIDGLALNPSDVQAIASVMKKCGYLNEVSLFHSDINDEKIDILSRNLMESTLKIDHLELSENDLRGRISSVAKLAKHCDVKTLGIDGTNLKREHLDQVIKENHQFQNLNVSANKEIEAAGWYIVGGLMADNALALHAGGCKLDATKVSELDKGLRSKTVEVLNLTDDLFCPVYTRALLGLLPHVNKELNLDGWRIYKDGRRELQEKLNEIGSPNLKIIIEQGFERTVILQKGGKGELTSVEPRHQTARRLSQSEDEEKFPEESRIVVKSLDSKDVGIQVVQNELEKGFHIERASLPEEMTEPVIPAIPLTTPAQEKVSQEPHPTDDDTEGNVEFEVGRTLTDSWSKWISQLAVDAPPKIVKVLAQADRDIKKSKSYIDKAFSDVHLSQMMERGKAYLLHQIAHAYQSIADHEQSKRAAEEVIDLLCEADSLDGNMKILQLSSLCCAIEVCLDVRDITQAFVHYQRAKDVLEDLDVSAPNYETLAGRFKKLKIRLEQFHRREEQSTRCIGANGGVLEFIDGKIYFPKSCVGEEVLLHAFTTIAPSESNLPNKICVTPTLRLNPTTKLQKSAVVTLATWLASCDASSIHVYVKETENCGWKPLPREDVKLSGNRVIQFNITQLCKFCAMQDVKEAADSVFWVESWLFYETERKQVANCIFPRCKTYENQVLERMKDMDFKRVCTSDPTFEVRIDDGIEVQLDRLNGTEQIPSQTSGISLEFLRKKRHTSQNFSLASYCGLVKFIHNVKQTRNLQLIDEEKHDDQIVLKLPESKVGTQVNVAQNIATNEGQLEIKQKNCNSRLEVNTQS